MMAEPTLAPAAHAAAWFEQLTQRCDAERVRLPGPDALHHKLSQPQPVPHARGRLAQLLNTEWVKGRQDVPAWQLQAVVEAIEHWWHALAPADTPLAGGLDAGLATAWLRAQGQLGQLSALLRATQVWGARLADPAHEAEALMLLRQLRRLKGSEVVPPSLALVEALGPRWTPQAPWSPDLAGTLAMVARSSEELAPLAQVRAWVERMAPHATGADAQAWRSPLLAAAARCAALPALRLLIAAAADAPSDDATAGSALGTAVETLAHLAPNDPTTRTLVSRAAAGWTHQPTVQAEWARLQRAGGAPVAALAPALRALDAEHPATPGAWQLLAEYAFADGDLALANECYERLQAVGALDEHTALRQAHLGLQGHVDAGQYVPGMALPTAEAQALDPGLLGPLAPALHALDALVLRSVRHDSPHTVADLEAEAARALAAFEAALPTVDATVSDLAGAAGHLWERANTGALDLAHWEGAFPFDLGPGLGTLDGYRCRAVCRGVMQHVVALCRHAVRRPCPLRGAPTQASLSGVLALLAQGLDAHVGLRQPAAALRDLDAAAEALAGVADEAVAALRHRAWLAVGDVDAVRKVLAAPAETAGTGSAPAAPTRNAAPDVLTSLEWSDWLAAQGASDHGLIQDARFPGRFEVVNIAGQLRTETHDALPTTLSVARLSDVRVRNVHLLIAPGAGMLRPHPWHVQMAEFPYPHPNVIARGARGAVLRAPTQWMRVDEPLLVLANMDAPFHRNYYHWMVLTLTRIQALSARGLLKTRRLLLPRELAGWMVSSLRDIGLEDTQIRWYGGMDDLHLTDALVASPAEFASPTMVELLRQQLTRAAGLDPDRLPPPTRLIYLARRGETRRPLVEAEQVIDIAESLGFEIIAPEALSLLDQVRLLASARGVAGPPGAAFTNLMWAPATTRVLTIFKQDINSPTFFDLSFLRGQRHRWLQARSIAGFEGVSIVTSPFSVDLDLARRELTWVRDGDAA